LVGDENLLVCKFPNIITTLVVWVKIMSSFQTH
ncbi:MAG: hypothetical protein ACI8YI_000766, partial [Paracoccaceae bacterium]